MQSSRAFRDIAERILYHDVILQPVPHKPVVHRDKYRDSPQMDHYDDMASPLVLKARLSSFRLVDPLFTKMPRLLDIDAPVLPNLKKLCLSTSPLDIKEFAAFLSQRADALEHLEISPWDDYSATPLHFDLPKIFQNIEGARNLTHLKLAPSLGDDTDVLLARPSHYAEHLANVTTFSCSFFHAGVFRLAGMMPRPERLNINLLLDIDIDCLTDENPGMHHEIVGYSFRA